MSAAASLQSIAAKVGKVEIEIASVIMCAGFVRNKQERPGLNPDRTLEQQVNQLLEAVDRLRASVA